MNEYEELARLKMAGFLPLALEKCASEYEQRMYERIPDEDDKKTKSYNDASKSTLTHFLTLLKLCQLADKKPLEKEEDSGDLATALAEVEAYQNDNKTHDELA